MSRDYFGVEMYCLVTSDVSSKPIVQSLKQLEGKKMRTIRKLIYYVAIILSTNTLSI